MRLLPLNKKFVRRSPDSLRGERVRGGRWRAFTLIELLVVVGMIGVLAALLLPAMAGAKDKARRFQCANNLRQWTLAFIMYKDDHGFIPREGSLRNGNVRLDNWANVQDPANSDVWYNALPPYLSVRPASTYASRFTGERPKFYQDRLFHCPSVRFPAGFDVDNSARFSLAMNSKLIMPPIQYPEASIPFELIQRPGETAAFTEARVTSAEWKVIRYQSDENLGQPSAFASRFAARHRRAGNVAFCDGRVASFAGNKVVETRSGRDLGWGIFPDGEILWCADPLEDPNRPD